MQTSINIPLFGASVTDDCRPEHPGQQGFPGWSGAICSPLPRTAKRTSRGASYPYRARTGGKVGLTVPIRTRPLSANFAGLVCTGGKAGLTVPMPTLPLSLVEEFVSATTFSALIFFTVCPPCLAPARARGTIYSGREGKLLSWNSRSTPV